MAVQRLSDLAEQYIADRKKYAAKTTVGTPASVARRFAAAWDETRRSPKSLDGVFVEDWFAELDVAPSTRAMYRTHLNAFLKWCIRRKHVTSDALDYEVPVGKSSDRTRPLLWLPGSFFEEAIAAEDNWYWRGLLATLTYTLGRGIEIRERRVADVRLGDGFIFWPRTKTKDYDDFIPILKNYRPELERYLAAYREHVGEELRDDYYLFPRYGRNVHTGVAWVRPTEQRCLITRPAKHLIEKNLDPEALADNPEMLVGVGGHTARRSMARALYERLIVSGHNEAIAVVQGMLGHKSRATTEHYIGITSVREIRNAALKDLDLFPSTAASSAAVVDIAATRGRTG